MTLIKNLLIQEVLALIHKHDRDVGAEWAVWATAQPDFLVPKVYKLSVVDFLCIQGLLT